MINCEKNSLVSAQIRSVEITPSYENGHDTPTINPYIIFLQNGEWKIEMNVVPW